MTVVMVSNATNRINARLDDDLARKVELVCRRTNRSVSQVVKESLVRFCDAELGQASAPRKTFDAAGFVGCAEGPAEYSSNYKVELTRSLKRKA
jgi:predicted transcriptional regulator